MKEVIEALNDFVDEIGASVRRIGEATEKALAGGPTSRVDLGQVEACVLEALHGRPSLVHGGGYVAAPGQLFDARWWLEWFAWDHGTVQRLLIDTDPDGAHFFDYTYFPWYADLRADSEDRTRVLITGPYVDYLCTDDYTLTFTTAVQGPSGFAGVAGVDVRVKAVEEVFMPVLRRCGRRAVLVNRHGRVLLSNDPRLLSGELVEDVDVPALFADPPPELSVVGGRDLAVLDLGPR